MPEIWLNSAELESHAVKSWEATMYWLQGQFIKEFTENKWAWPSGQSPRDIIDTAALRNQTMAPGQARVTPLIYDWAWNLDYALGVHNGVTFRDGRSYPARPWTEQPVDKLGQAYAAIYQGGRPPA